MTHHHPLEPLFAPRSIAVVGASDRPGSVGQIVLSNLRSGGFAGELFAINDKRSTVQGLRAFPSVRALERSVDLAVIAVPAACVPQVLTDCGRVGVRTAVVISAGFAESGADGVARQAQLVEIARRYHIRVVGPNCVGVVRPSTGLHAFFGLTRARPGRLALVSQSGAVCTAILDWAEANQIGFSTVVSIGSAADVGFGEVLDYLALDPDTDAVLLYAEGVDHARKFMSGLRAAARMKPVVALKAGRYAASRKAAASHTGALVGDDAAFDAALRRAGAVRANTLDELFSAANLLASGARTAGERIAIVTNAGGLGVMAADRATERKLAFATLSTATLTALDGVLPAHWSHGNPIDLIGDAPPDRYAQALAAVLSDPGVDGAIVLLSPQAMTQPAEVAKHLIALHGDRSHKPVLASFVGGPEVREAQNLLAHAGVPHFPSPEAAVDAFAYLCSFERNQRLLLEVPGPLAEATGADLGAARAIIAVARRERRNTLTLAESKALLQAFHVPVTACTAVATPEAAAAAAQHTGFPVVLKIDSPDITHKSDVDGVAVGLATPDAVRSAFDQELARAKRLRPSARILGATVEPMHGKRHGRELIAGIARDIAFGPVMSVGIGGTFVEVIGDHSIALPPLNAAIAREMIERSRARRLLGEFRGMPAVDLSSIEQVLLRLSELACELPEVREFDINPLVVDECGAVAVDARIILDENAPAIAARSRYGHVAIEPYPAQLARVLDVPGKGPLVVRPIRPEDAELERAFVGDLSPDARYMRFHAGLSKLTPRMLVRLTQIDYDREMAFIAVRKGAAHDEVAGIARYTAEADGESCEFALAVADAWQRLGVGTSLMRTLIESARSKGIRRMFGIVLTENHKMLDLTRALGFLIQPDPEDPTLRIASLDLAPEPADA